MFLIVEKGTRGEICHSIYLYAKFNNKYMNDYDKNKELSYLQYQHVNNLFRRPLAQKLPVNNFDWIEDSVKIYNEESDKGYYLQANV